MRTTNLAFVLLLALLLLAVACGEEAKPLPISAAVESTPPLPGRPPASSADTREPARAPRRTIDVLGNVVDESRAAVVGRTVTIVDALGHVTKTLTDEGGTFWVHAVATPYDLAIEPAPYSARAVPMVYLGLRHAEPSFVVVEREGSLARAAAQTLRVVVGVPACFAPSCWVTVVSSSPSGAGQSASRVTARAGSVVVELEHAFDVAEVPEGETIRLHALTGDEGYSELAYGEGTVEARAGGATFAVVTPSRVQTTGMLTIFARGDAIPEGWDWTLSTRLRLPGGATMALHYVEGPVLVTRLPRIDGARLEAGAWAQRPPRDGEGVVERSSFVWSGPSPLGTPDVRLELPAGLGIERPGQSGRLSLRASGFAWTRGSAGVSIVELTDARGRRLFRAHTADGALPFARLDALGVNRPQPGTHDLDVTAYGDSTLEDAVDPSQARAPATIGRDRAGTIAHERVRFQVVP